MMLYRELKSLFHKYIMHWSLTFSCDNVYRVKPSWAEQVEQGDDAGMFCVLLVVSGIQLPPAMFQPPLNDVEQL